MNSSYYPDLSLTFGPSYTTGEPVGFFAIANDSNTTSGIDGAAVIDQSASGVVNEAKGAEFLNNIHGFLILTYSYFHSKHPINCL